MHEVIKVYGKTILQAIILVGVMWLVFRGVTDETEIRESLRSYLVIWIGRRKTRQILKRL